MCNPTTRSLVSFPQVALYKCKITIRKSVLPKLLRSQKVKHEKEETTKKADT